MNVARVMGNSMDPIYIPDLERAFRENTDDRVQGMIAWALGRIGWAQGLSALQNCMTGSHGLVKAEIEAAMADNQCVTAQR